ncbi:MAG: hypothetical protein A2Y73_00825 [Chloroflexi bacterium RBG_13_56_8]|nr:MAG: hypothetical protein A2Y73_00825 [Chloroflexi bacterium RBG_13_56_8]
MEPQIVDRDAFTFLGVLVRGNPMEADYSDIWERQFMPYYDRIAPSSINKAYYCVYFETGEENLADIMAAMAVGDVASVPEGLQVRVTPATRYAVFECTMPTIGKTWQRIFGDWLPNSQYTHNVSMPSFEYFPPDAEQQGEFPVRIYVPVREK